MDRAPTFRLLCIIASLLQSEHGGSIASMTRRLLLLSSSRDANGVYLLHSASAIRSTARRHSRARSSSFPTPASRSPTREYSAARRGPVRKAGLRAAVDRRCRQNPVRAVESAEAIVVGGGNTFQLLASLYDRELIVDSRARACHAGVPYIGWSAGAVITAPTIGTTNDMPIIEPTIASRARSDPVSDQRALHRFSPARSSGRDARGAPRGIHRGESHDARARTSRRVLAPHHRR